ncbi:hypothetical protein [Bradyrhizobium sp. Arg816]|uniref:hypothetical protein n=1 Tax=Bradyrhizobium sp. Arg816 TaxID=2998491 RepID=UPI00249DE702|nr:hypothetical protein [Bradyrhizobium sp. Arg816]MDI3566656.1 hypothetical protein [Bradyrhizobium sp. Arg816]
MSVVLFLIAYLVQLGYGNEGTTRPMQLLHRLAYVPLVGSLVAFLLGLRFAYDAVVSAVGG